MDLRLSRFVTLTWVGNGRYLWLVQPFGVEDFAIRRHALFPLATGLVSVPGCDSLFPVLAGIGNRHGDVFLPEDDIGGILDPVLLYGLLWGKAVDGFNLFFLARGQESGAFTTLNVNSPIL